MIILYIKFWPLLDIWPFIAIVRISLLKSSVPCGQCILSSFTVAVGLRRLCLHPWISWAMYLGEKRTTKDTVHYVNLSPIPCVYMQSATFFVFVHSDIWLLNVNAVSVMSSQSSRVPHFEQWVVVSEFVWFSKNMRYIQTDSKKKKRGKKQKEYLKSGQR